MARLIVIKGPEKGHIHQLTEDAEQVVGRKDAPILVPEKLVSRRHARFFVKDERWYVEDLGSSNGTEVNGKRIDRPTKLHKGDLIRIGHTVMSFGRPRGADHHHGGHESDPPTADKPSAATTPQPQPPGTPKSPAPAAAETFNPDKTEIISLDDDQDSGRKDSRDASSILLEVFDSDEVPDADTIDEYVPDYDPLNPKTHRSKHEHGTSKGPPPSKK